jgi:hypothetical protein
MKVRTLKRLLDSVPDNADILLNVNNHDQFTDTDTHGKSRAVLLTIEGKPVLFLSADDCGLRYRSLNYQDLKVIKKLR